MTAHTAATKTTTTPIALITGGSRGLGKSTALHLAAQGSDIILTYRSAKAEAEATVAAIQALGRQAVALQLDVGHSASFAGFAEAVNHALATCHITNLINGELVTSLAPAPPHTPNFRIHLNCYAVPLIPVCCPFPNHLHATR